MSFDKLLLAELVRTADEDFAFELSPEERKSKKLALAAFAEAELKFSDYLLANPGEAEKYKPVVVEEVVVPVVAATPDAVAPQLGTTIVNNVAVAEAPVVSQAPYLIKMDRENPYYEVGKYKFSHENPYALVDAKDAMRVLTEPGFRQANPDELNAYYSNS